MIERVNEHLGSRLVVSTGDITEFDGDALVNAANSSLLGGGGVDGAIHRAAGPALLAACKQLRKDALPNGLPPGEAVSTVSGNLAVQHVIHTVGPVWHGGDQEEDDVLKSAYHASVREARRLGAATVAFPAISTGVYGFPRQRAAQLAFSALAKEITEAETPQEIWLVFYSNDDAQTFEQAIRS